VDGITVFEEPALLGSLSRLKWLSKARISLISSRARSLRVEASFSRMSMIFLIRVFTLLSVELYVCSIVGSPHFSAIALRRTGG